ncbi:VacJ family lipoprotein [Alphaproteobacteria bacterium]|nr:VacJ family lipoprotein [Alphaproteobacteria bacterium]
MKKLFQIKLLFLLIFFSSQVLANEENIETSVRYDQIYDPIEPVNRAVLNFNFFIDDIAIRPVVKTYKFIAPDPVEKGVSNFFSNLKEPIRGISFVFQGEFMKSLNSVGRFTVNSLTSLGTFDLASRIGMTKNETDIGLTLAKNGVSSGPYIVIPIIGPSNLRDLSGNVVEYFVDPISNNIQNRTYISVGSGLNARAEVDEEVDQVRELSTDRYELIKSVYYQRRNSQIEEDFVQNLPTPKIYID